MEYSLTTRTVQAVNKQITNDTIRLTHKLQREEGQWKTSEKSDLIDSIFRKYPIVPCYGIKEDGVVSIIDGVQRLSTIRDYLNDAFSLSKNMKPVMINGTERDLSNKKFSKLDEDVKDELLNAELQIYELRSCTDEDIREIFKRQNAGKPLNSRQKRVIFGSDDFNEAVYGLRNHEFVLKNSSKAQRKNNTTRDWIIQSLMLISTTHENDFTSFKQNDMNKFVSDYGEQAILEKSATLKEAMDKLNSVFEEKLNIKQLDFPMVLFAAYRCTKDKKSFAKLSDAINKFIMDYNNNSNTLADYKKHSQSSTTSRENVGARFNYWKNILKTI